MAEPHALLHEVSAYIYIYIYHALLHEVSAYIYIYIYIDDLCANTNKSILVSSGCANPLHHLQGQRQGGNRESH